jgi:uncharacterized membrane-anchored protein
MTIASAAPEKTAPNRVPEVNVDFWLIKLLAVTVGETAADYMNLDLDLGLTTTSWLLSGVLCAALLLQFAQRRYVPWVYWLAIVLISVVGTLVTDNLVDNFGVSQVTSTVVFSAALAAAFAAWYLVEKTLSIHTIYTARREAFYWLVILLTFALGTAAGDLLSERIGLGYLVSGIIFSLVIAIVAAGYYMKKIDGITGFWLAYIFTRPVGASLGDYFSQPPEYGGLGFGSVATSYIFFAAIIATVAYMSVRQAKPPQALASEGSPTE